MLRAGTYSSSPWADQDSIVWAFDKGNGMENGVNTITRQILAEAHLKVREIGNALELREKNGLHNALAEEVGFDLGRVVIEINKAKGREFFYGIFHFVSVCAALISINMMDSWSSHERAGGMVLLICSVLFAGVIEFLAVRSRKKYVRNNIIPIKIDNSKSVASDASSHNLIIPDGFEPFSGSGYPVSQWSFVVDLTKPENESESVDSIDINDIYDEVTECVKAMGLVGLEISDRLVVHGQDIRNNKMILPDLMGPPVSSVDDGYVLAVIGKNGTSMRHYRLFRVSGWGGQLVISTFLRLGKIGGGMFVENKTCMLTPLREYYRTIDNFPVTSNSKEWMGDFVRSVASGWFHAVRTAFSALSWILELLSFAKEEREKKKFINNNENYNYGSGLSLREQLRSSVYDRYFQMLDKDMLVKAINQKLLDAIALSLRKRNISTDSFKERGAQILNHGVIVSGSQMNVENMAVGEKSSIINSISKAVGVKS